MGPIGGFDAFSFWPSRSASMVDAWSVSSVDESGALGGGPVIFEFLNALDDMASESETGLSLESERSSLADKGGRVACTRADGDGPTVIGLSTDGALRGTDDERLGEADGVLRPSGTCNRRATWRA